MYIPCKTTPLGGSVLLALACLGTPTSFAVDPIRSVHVHDGGHFEVANYPDINPTRAITIAAWIWRDSNEGYQTIVGKDYRYSYWLGITPTGRIRFYPRGTGSNLDGINPVPLRHWTHIAVTYDGTTRRYYINGQLDFESAASPGPVGVSGAPLMFGADVTGFPFSGYLHHVAFWGTALWGSAIGDVMYPDRARSRELPSLFSNFGNWYFQPGPTSVFVSGGGRGSTAVGVAPFERCAAEPATKCVRVQDRRRDYGGRLPDNRRVRRRRQRLH